MSKTISLRIPDFLARFLIGKKAYDYLKDDADVSGQPILTRKANFLGLMQIEVIAVGDTSDDNQSDNGHSDKAS